MSSAGIQHGLVSRDVIILVRGQHVRHPSSSQRGGALTVPPSKAVGRNPYQLREVRRTNGVEGGRKTEITKRTKEYVTRPTIMLGGNRNARDWAIEDMTTDGNRMIDRKYRISSARESRRKRYCLSGLTERLL
jgi:hypothetical protein